MNLRKITAFNLLFALGSSFTFAATPSEIPALLQKVEAKYAKAATMAAVFNETDVIAALHQTKKSSGTLNFKRPGKVRWETLSPDKNLLISDGKTFWFYTPPFDVSDAGQYIEKKASQVQSRLAQALLSASFSSNEIIRKMKISKKTETKFVLTPKAGSAGTVIKAEIGIDPTTLAIQSVRLEHKGGNRSEITLSKIELGKPLEDGLFHFTPPPNTEKASE